MTAKNDEDVKRFIDNLWFYAFFFVLLVMIASFGLIAEAQSLHTSQVGSKIGCGPKPLPVTQVLFCA